MGKLTCTPITFKKPSSYTLDANHLENLWHFLNSLDDYLYYTNRLDQEDVLACLKAAKLYAKWLRQHTDEITPVRKHELTALIRLAADHNEGSQRADAFKLFVDINLHANQPITLSRHKAGFLSSNELFAKSFNCQANTRLIRQLQAHSQKKYLQYAVLEQLGTPQKYSPLFDLLSDAVNKKDAEKTAQLLNIIRRKKHSEKCSYGRKQTTHRYYKALVTCLTKIPANANAKDDSLALTLLKRYATKHKNDITAVINDPNFIIDQLTRNTLLRQVMYTARRKVCHGFWKGHCDLNSGQLAVLKDKLSPEQQTLITTRAP